MEFDDLIKHATYSRNSAYAIYSDFKVGAALQSEEGQIFGGCNIENVSFGLTMCAERVALGTAMEKGVSKFAGLAIVADSKEPIVPCGACRQVLAEFSPNLRIVSATLTGEIMLFDLAVLLPKPRQGILE